MKVRDLIAKLCRANMDAVVVMWNDTGYRYLDINDLEEQVVAKDTPYGYVSSEYVDSNGEYYNFDIPAVVLVE